jgi:chemotaxis signal transduction protein
MTAQSNGSTYELPWLILRLDGKLYALEIPRVREMVQMVDLNPLPHAPEYIRGVTQRREQSLTVVDLRRRLGMRGADEEVREIIEMLRAREQDHVRWITELESCVREDREFTLARDPSKCAFGQWYAAFHTDNLTLGAHLKRFERPHAQIHALADEVLALASSGKHDQAVARIAETRDTTLDLMRRLFREGIAVLQSSVTETLVVLEAGSQLLGITTDVVDSVEHLEEGSIQEIALPGGSWDKGHSLVRNTAMTARSNRLVLVLEAEELLAAFTAVAAA